jgi:hypothetical protein
MKFLDLDINPPTLKNEGFCLVVNQGQPAEYFNVAQGRINRKRPRERGELKALFKVRRKEVLGRVKCNLDKKRGKSRVCSWVEMLTWSSRLQ